ncbi:MAG TPA: hypothetical protein VJV04_07410 [Nitrospiraceae bacterium]|nr:hypothetical protein [Nitrospiraceae bacterium]
MSHPRQEENRRLGDNDEAEPEKITSAERDHSVSKGQAAPLEDRKNEGSENTKLNN